MDKRNECRPSWSVRSIDVADNKPTHASLVCKVGKWADLVLWSPAFFGAKPEMVLKGGFIAWSQVRT